MKRQPLILYNLTNSDLRSGLYQILNNDEKWLIDQFKVYESRDKIYRERLDLASKRFDFQKEILSRLDKFQWVPISSAIDLIFEMYKFKIDPSKCHFTIEFCGLKYPQFHFHDPQIDNQHIRKVINY